MSDPVEKLEKVLRESDERRRPKRIERIVWLSKHNHLPNPIMGRVETLHLLEEASGTFIDGHFAAAFLLSISVINHSLIEELQLRGAIRGDPGLEKVVNESEKLEIVPVEWFPGIRRLVERRHAFAHFRAATHEHGLGMRSKREDCHSARLIEADAYDAMPMMYNVFRATLHEITF